MVWLFGASSVYKWLPLLCLKEKERREQLFKLKTSGTVVRAPTGPAAFSRKPSRTAGKHIPQIHSPSALRSPARGAHWLNPRGNQRRKELSMQSS